MLDPHSPRTPQQLHDKLAQQRLDPAGDPTLLPITFHTTQHVAQTRADRDALAHSRSRVQSAVRDTAQYLLGGVDPASIQDRNPLLGQPLHRPSLDGRGLGIRGIDGWELALLQQFQFGDLRVETPLATIVVEVGSAGGIGNLVKLP